MNHILSLISLSMLDLCSGCFHNTVPFVYVIPTSGYTHCILVYIMTSSWDLKPFTDVSTLPVPWGSRMLCLHHCQGEFLTCFVSLWPLFTPQPVAMTQEAALLAGYSVWHYEQYEWRATKLHCLAHQTPFT